MTVWVALLRAVNVGGKNALPMEGFRAALEGLGFEGVKTYIQSGNAVFRSDCSGAELVALIADAVLSRFGFRPPVIMLTLPEIESALTNCPFAAEQADKVHFYFMERALPRATNEFLRALATPTERYAFQGKVLWLHLPDGLGRSKLAARVGALPLDVTARNMKSVTALLALARKVASP